MSCEEINGDVSKLELVADAIKAQSKREFRSFSMFCSFDRRFVKGFAIAAAPLQSLTTDQARFKWTETTKKKFEPLKKHLACPPILSSAEAEKEIVVVVDACRGAVGSSFFQKKDDRQLYTVQYASRPLSKEEKNVAILKKRRFRNTQSEAVPALPTVGAVCHLQRPTSAKSRFPENLYPWEAVSLAESQGRMVVLNKTHTGK